MTLPEETCFALPVVAVSSCALSSPPLPSDNGSSSSVSSPALLDSAGFGSTRLPTLPVRERDSSGNNGAWEGIDLTADGASAVLGGFTKKTTTDEMAFRSYGNCGGEAVVMKLPISALTAASAPTSASATWTKAS